VTTRCGPADERIRGAIERPIYGPRVAARGVPAPQPRAVDGPQADFAAAAAAWQPATAAVPADNRDRRSTVGSNAAVGRSHHIPCAGRFVAEAVGCWWIVTGRRYA